MKAGGESRAQAICPVISGNFGQVKQGRTGDAVGNERKVDLEKVWLRVEMQNVCNPLSS